MSRDIFGGSEVNKVIKAILFDSGRVLNAPTTGHWFITPNFFQYVDKKAFSSIPKSQRNKAFSKAAEYISKQSLIETVEEEYKHFLEYYKIFLQHFPDLSLEDQQIEAITKDLVYNYDKYTFYQDAADTISGLSVNYKLAVVSDAWPSLENVFRNAGLRDYFSSFVISSVIGATKPNKLMYETALKELCVSPEEAVFIDDNIKNCNGAKQLGIKTFLLCRDYKLFLYYKLMCKDHIVIRNLKSINSLI